MSSATLYLEELIYKFLSKTLTDEEKRCLSTGWDAEKHIDEQSEDEMRNEIFFYVKSRIHWANIISLLQEEAEEENSVTSDSESENNSDED